MDRYFDTPDAKFDHDIFEEIFDLLIKYKDREAVKMFWGLMQEMQVQPDPALRKKVLSITLKDYCTKCNHHDVIFSPPLNVQQEKTNMFYPDNYLFLTLLTFIVTCDWDALC